MLLLTEADVVELFPMPLAIERVEASLLAQHKGEATNRPRQRIFLPQSSLHYMAAALPQENLVGMKIYTVAHGVLRFVVLLFDAASGELLALLEADQLGRIRTGAASAVATKYMARAGRSRAGVIGVIGTGRQARTQLEAVAAATPVAGARVFGRDEARRLEFAREMSQRLGFPVDPAGDAEAAVAEADVVITATTSSQPVLRGDWLAPGTHINAIGANMAARRELDDAAIARAAVIAVDSLEQAREESGDLILGLSSRPNGWDDVHELHEIVGGSCRGRNSEDEITLFKSNGLALWDVAAAGAIYPRALEAGRGRKIELGEAMSR
ncbi:MAG TPA: ornithine cyclodeaminase family protein [Terriglobia bacterium]|nr:ornithine cyclodeaminase family protein [Terriglobia bacterium]